MLISDWSSDVCSSDLHQIKGADRETEIQFRCLRKTDHFARHTTTKQNVAFQRAHAPHHAFDQRGFARTVGADDRGQRARCEDAAGITYGNVLTPPQPDTLQFDRSEEHTSELQSLMRISYAVFCLKKKKY